ncbi:Ribonuclease h domain, partial [Thalictrum thalictroides]
MAWAIQHEKSDWGKFMRGKYLNKHNEWSDSKHSTVWSGMKFALKIIRKKQDWFVGNGKSINIWKDHWIGDQPLCDYISPKSPIWKKLSATLSSCIVDGQWSWPAQLVEITTRLGLHLEDVKSPNIEKDDEAYWPFDDQGKMTAKSAMEAIRTKQ